MCSSTTLAQETRDMRLQSQRQNAGLTTACLVQGQDHGHVVQDAIGNSFHRHAEMIQLRPVKTSKLGAGRHVAMRSTIGGFCVITKADGMSLGYYTTAGSYVAGPPGH